MKCCVKKLQQKATVTEMIRKERMAWFSHVTRMDGNRLPASVLYCHVEGRKSRGRQSKKWIDNVKEDIKRLNLDVKTAMNIA